MATQSIFEHDFGFNEKKTVISTNKASTRSIDALPEPSRKSGGNNVQTEESQLVVKLASNEHKCSNHYKQSPSLDQMEQVYDHKKLKVKLINRCISAQGRYCRQQRFVKTNDESIVVRRIIKPVPTVKLLRNMTPYFEESSQTTLYPAEKKLSSKESNYFCKGINLKIKRVARSGKNDFLNSDISKNGESESET